MYMSLNTFYFQIQPVFINVNEIFDEYHVTHCMKYKLYTYCHQITSGGWVSPKGVWLLVTAFRCGWILLSFVTFDMPLKLFMYILHVHMYIHNQRM